MFPSHYGPWSYRSRDEVVGHRLQKGIVRRALSYAARYKGQVALFLGATVAGSLLAAVPPLLFRQLIDVALNKRKTGLLAGLAAAAIGIAVATAAVGLAARWFSARVGEGLIFDLRVRLFDHVQRMPIAFFTRVQTGALLSRLNTDVIGAQQAVTGTLGTIVANTIAVASILVVMLALQWKLTLLALGVLPLFLIPAKRFGRRLAGTTRAQMELNAGMNTLMTERFNVAGALVAKLFGRPERETDAFAGRAARVRDIGVRLAVVVRGFFVLLGVIAAVGTAVVYYVGGRMVIDDAITLGTLAAFAAYVTQLYGPLAALTNARVDLMTAFVSFERVFEVLDLPHPITDGPQVLPRPAGEVAFDDVWFRYPAGHEVGLASLEGELRDRAEEEQPVTEYVLHDLSFTIPAGETVALVGPSGAGKTTMAMLIARIYDASQGAVRIDGRDVRDLTLQSLHDAVGIVPQDPHLFHDTIANNLRFAKPEATDEQIQRACRAAQIHDLIVSLPDGYETVVGERGYRLSGGEKQRVAIARLLLKDPAIVILDEATSHLDSESESLIQRAFDEVLRERTSIVIAHRLSTITGADEIMVVDRGTVAERGSHADLLSAGGLYSELYETQFTRADP